MYNMSTIGGGSVVSRQCSQSVVLLSNVVSFQWCAVKFQGRRRSRKKGMKVCLHNLQTASCNSASRWREGMDLLAPKLYIYLWNCLMCQFIITMNEWMKWKSMDKNKETEQESVCVHHHGFDVSSDLLVTPVVGCYVSVFLPSTLP